MTERDYSAIFTVHGVTHLGDADGDIDSYCGLPESSKKYSWWNSADHRVDVLAVVHNSSQTPSERYCKRCLGHAQAKARKALDAE